MMDSDVTCHSIIFEGRKTHQKQTSYFAFPRGQPPHTGNNRTPLSPATEKISSSQPHPQAEHTMKKKWPVRRPSAPTQLTRPKPAQKGTRSSPLSIQSSLKERTAILADSAKVLGLTLGHRGSAHRPGWSLRLVRGSQKRTFTIEMILCCEGVSSCIHEVGVG
jgi:hypothetical protein